MVSIVIPFRNREISRLKRSLESLKRQTCVDFEVLVVDYGSKEKISRNVKDLLEEYLFATYYYYDTGVLPWNRSHALNLGVRRARYEHIFPADVDLIYHRKLVEEIIKLLKVRRVVTFRTAYLSKNNKEWKHPERMKIKRISGKDATGMTLFDRAGFERIRGYDEKFIYWGGEDNDIIKRFEGIGYTHFFYLDEVLLFHQWHPPTELNEEAYPSGLKSFVRDSKIGNIFQFDRPRGELFEVRKEFFLKIPISPIRFRMEWEISEILQRHKKEDLICLNVSPTRRKVRYEKGFQSYFFTKANQFLMRKGFNLKWKFDEAIYSSYEVRDGILKLRISHSSKFDIMGMEINERAVAAYIRILR